MSWAVAVPVEAEQTKGGGKTLSVRPQLTAEALPTVVPTGDDCQGEEGRTGPSWIAKEKTGEEKAKRPVLEEK